MNAIDTLNTALRAAPIVPVLTIEDPGDVAPLAKALSQGGITTAEITLRTPAALEVIAEFKHASDKLLVGAGTVLTEADMKNALEAGAEFIVSPGLTDRLAHALLETGAPAIPGVATPSEAMQRYEDGFRLLKLFPAGAINGYALLKALAAPLPHLQFMPTGGVTPQNAGDYLALPNVRAIGGSWLATKTDIANQNWDAVEANAKAALAKISK